MIKRKSAYTFTNFICMREKQYENNTYHHKLAQLEYLRELIAHAADGSKKQYRLINKNKK